ncbi:hypothetical protein BHM03_00049580 [Ensete ventricosum]|nr:hypothetical protein BHM03_00049580 [Ensete ventricosum]
MDVRMVPSLTWSSLRSVCRAHSVKQEFGDHLSRPSQESHFLFLILLRDMWAPGRLGRSHQPCNKAVGDQRSVAQRNISTCLVVLSIHEKSVRVRRASVPPDVAGHRSQRKRLRRKMPGYGI